MRLSVRKGLQKVNRLNTLSSVRTTESLGSAAYRNNHCQVEPPEVRSLLPFLAQVWPAGWPFPLTAIFCGMALRLSACWIGEYLCLVCVTRTQTPINGSASAMPVRLRATGTPSARGRALMARIALDPRWGYLMVARTIISCSVGKMKVSGANPDEFSIASTALGEGTNQHD